MHLGLQLLLVPLLELLNHRLPASSNLQPNRRPGILSIDTCLGSSILIPGSLLLAT
uniref:Cytochrome c biogenesis B n=1 Tax=Picea glauca TaxID=3330 RepID=A0A101M596_PICGL|nr:hypothetical protein ABT39_MTgene983 [Picea glauca]QHR92230.1 hypothetical protein Q903MT_gene6269 [Picea sitchensis]